METTYFVLGMLTIVATCIMAAVVVGLLKINKLTNELRNTRLDLDMTRRNLYQAIDETSSFLRKHLEETGRDITMVEKTIMQRIDQFDNHIHRRIDEDNMHMHRRVDELNSYVDRRFDKLVDTYFSVKEAEKESKKLIKG